MESFNINFLPEQKENERKESDTVRKSISLRLYHFKFIINGTNNKLQIWINREVAAWFKSGNRDRNHGRRITNVKVT